MVGLMARILRPVQPQKLRYVDPEHVIKTFDAFQQYLNISFAEMSRRMGFGRSTKIASIRTSTSVCTYEISIKLFREFGFLIDDYADQDQGIPDALKREVIEYLDALIQPFAPKGHQHEKPPGQES